MQKHLTSIVAIDQRGAIGCKNRLPWSIKSDMAFFRKTTTGSAVIMGRKTYDSIGGYLKGRHNLVLSHSYNLFPSTDTCKLVNSVGEALAAAETVDSEEIFVIGGAATYLEFSPFVDRYLLTIVDHTAAHADAFLAQSILGDLDGWQNEELGSYPALMGKDDFAFRIVAFSAPDAPARLELRSAMVQDHLKKRLNIATSKIKPKRPPNRGLQAAFSF